MIYLFTLSQFHVCMLVNCDGFACRNAKCTVYLPSCSFFLMIIDDKGR
ncbi:hypothetical protein PVAP13_7KG411433 [Panicum virgatum]|uniref:Uncharacterized protein n=1 Tax=Panicum virgatum TaxID=38727 RepID=A0A8T0QPW4_PANVG|nr:hypothetical protein PVAP13_7KG411433 [Panicum virgatum]